VTIETTPARTVAYGDDPAQVYDVLAPAAPRDTTVLVVHGGFWQADVDRAHTAEQVAGLAAAGYHVAVGEYRRWSATDQGWWRETLADVESLVRAVAADAGLPDRLVVMGHSAGGQLAAWAAGQPWIAECRVAGVVSLAGCVDLAVVDRLQLGDDAARAFLGGGPDVVPEAWAAADPARALPVVPVRLVSGDDDEEVPVEVSRSYAARFATADVTLDVIPGVAHFAYLDPTDPVWPHVLATVESLLG